MQNKIFVSETLRHCDLRGELIVFMTPISFRESQELSMNLRVRCALLTKA